MNFLETIIKELKWIILTLSILLFSFTYYISVDRAKNTDEVVKVVTAHTAATGQIVEGVKAVKGVEPTEEP